MFRVALRLLLAAALGAVPSLARADVYRWVDDAGATHYATTRDAIPRRFRSSAEVIEPARPTVSNPSSAQPHAPAPSVPPVEPAAPSTSSPEPAPSPASEPKPESVEPQSSAPIAAPPAPASETARSHSPVDPRADEIAQLEGQIERDRETLRQLISTQRWDSAELASDPRVREIAERLPRLQAELSALRTEAER